jgi:hypothetical protein
MDNEREQLEAKTRRASRKTHRKRCVSKKTRIEKDAHRRSRASKKSRMFFDARLFQAALAAMTRQPFTWHCAAARRPEGLHIFHIVQMYFLKALLSPWSYSSQKGLHFQFLNLSSSHDLSNASIHKVKRKEKMQKK